MRILDVNLKAARMGMMATVTMECWIFPPFLGSTFYITYYKGLFSTGAYLNESKTIWKFDLCEVLNSRFIQSAKTYRFHKYSISRLKISQNHCIQLKWAIKPIFTQYIIKVTI